MSEVGNLNGGETRQQPLVWVLLACSAGMVADRGLPFSFPAACAGALLALVLWLSMRRWRGQMLVTGWLLLAVALTGAAWHHLCWRLFRSDELGLAAAEEARPVAIEAVALGTPRRLLPLRDPLLAAPAEEQSLLTVEVVGVRDGRVWKTASGRASVLVDGRLQPLTVGARLRIFGVFSSEVRPLNPGEFDFAADRRCRRELCRVRCDSTACLIPAPSGAGWRPGYALHWLRAQGNALLWKYLDHDQAGLASAVLLGSREQIDSGRLQNFVVTGTVHVLSISGLHVGILAAGFWFLARWGWLPRRATLCLAMVLVIWYALLTESRPPVVRAAVLISVICVARLLGRRAFDFNTLSLAGLIVLAMNPTSLFNTGTQLSFLAVATLASSQRWSYALSRPEDPLQRLISQSRPWPVRIGRRVGGLCWQLVLASAAIWIVALPLVMYRFHLVSPIAVVLNPIIWAPMGVALFAGFGVLLFGWILPPAAVVCGWACDRSLAGVENCVHLGLQLPHGHAWTPAPALWWVLAFYAGLGLTLAVPRLRPTRGWGIAILAVWFAIGFALTLGPLARPHRSDDVVCTFVAVGHGTSVLVELPDGRALLYDAGRLGASASSVRPIAAVLWSRGITHLDAVIVSHADSDHYNALPELLQRFSVGVVYVSPLMFRDPSEALDVLRQAIESQSVPLRELDSTDRLRAEGVVLEVLHPPRRGVLGSDNANSIVLRITYEGRTILLPGDLESPGLEDVLAESPLDCDLVMAPHHGSVRSNPRGFSRWSTPEWVVISGGRAGDMEQLRGAYQRSSTRALHTQMDGAIQAVLSRDALRVARWSESRWQPLD